MWDNNQSIFHQKWQAANESQSEKERISDGSIEVNGVRLPAYVVWELRRFGLPFERFTQQELIAAVQACIIDRRLIDDPNGYNFLDDLTLTAREKDEDSCAVRNPFHLNPISHRQHLHEESARLFYGKHMDDDERAIA